MEMKDICPCANMDCPNHGNCENCISLHLSRGYLNYCAFHTVLPDLRAAIAADPESPAAKKVAALVDARLQGYAKLMAKHGLTPERQEGLLKQVAEFKKP